MSAPHCVLHDPLLGSVIQHL